MSSSLDEPTISIVRRIADRARETPDEVGYVHLGMDGGETAVTWDELHRRSSQVAAAFAERGVGHGDRVGLGVRNSPELVFSVFASWKLGAVPIPVRWDVPGWELDRLRSVVDPALYVSPDDLAWIRGTANDVVPTLEERISPNSHGICSSGSTGTPKVILSQSPAMYSPLMGTPIAAAFLEVASPQRILVLAPMYHINAFVALSHMLAGDQVFVLEKFDAARAVGAIEEHRLTTFTATPTMLQRIADLPGADERDLASLAWVLQGAAPMPPSLVHRWASLIGAEKLIMAYGATEGLGLTVLTGTEWLDHEGSVGTGFNGAEVRILDDEAHELPSGQIGRIFVRSPTYQGATYLGDAPPLHMTADGFGTVGDMGYVDEDGYLYLVDRRVDLIVTGGANVFPAEVEAALIDHPKVADVVVVGLKSDEWGRRVHAIVEPTDPDDPITLTEAKAYVKGRLSPYKVPKTIEIVGAIPRSEAMKVNRGRLVDERDG